MAVAGDVSGRVVLYCAVFFPTRYLGWDLVLNWVSSWGFFLPTLCICKQHVFRSVFASAQCDQCHINNVWNLRIRSAKIKDLIRLQTDPSSYSLHMPEDPFWRARLNLIFMKEHPSLQRQFIIKPLNILANRLDSEYLAKMTRIKCPLTLHYFSYIWNLRWPKWLTIYFHTTSQFRILNSEFQNS